ncbi:hypothetical protein BJ875DRAFT_532558 [Amylocarpus encephaloides]|uniref:RNA recognition motif-containing protein n=1 Tax=Amylocarpus encephaloides TaxID=45428 RepID=A0A9P8C942_9HELO|nr:hypothetical protein BJ875DRAFT_532558 [Amylocarpus encephaloides]
MAARPGEELVATLFADVHYYYGPPTAKPPHHRFDKGSYIYLFENALLRRARVEVANNAGTPEQDAFNGHLDSTHVQYSYKHSTLISLTVDGANRGGPPDGQEWHLPTFDPRNENKYMYRLHSVDIYFWVKEDALQFLNGVRRVLPHQQVTVQDEPVAPPPHQHDMSAVVQKLENVAITDPSYQQGQTRNSQTTSVPSALSRSSTGTFPGPPINSISRSSTTAFSGPPISATPQSTEAPNFAPLAYNPAAPAAPETIQHREKTPPPEDGAGNPLVAAAVSDQGQTYGAPFQHPGGFSGPPAPQQANYFSGPPAASAPPQFNKPPPSTGFQGQFGQPPPPSAGLQSPYAQHFQHSFAAPPTAPVAPAPQSQPPPSAVVSAPGPPPYHHSSPAPPAPHIPVTQQYAQYPGSPGQSSAGLSSPGIYSPLGAPANFSASQPPAQPTLPPTSAPPGGFSSYQYQSLSNTQPHTTDFSVHQQVYRPTEGESAPKAKKEVKPPRGKLEERAGRVEKLGGSLFKKLEKKIG